MATEKILIFDEAGNAKRMKVRIARFLDNEPVTASDKENIRTTLDVDGSQSGDFTTDITTTQKVGIGDTTPAHPLTLTANPGAANTPVAWLHNSGNVSEYDGAVISTVNDGSDVEVLHVRTNTTTYDGGNSLMLVRGDGNVGIGEDLPARNLHVTGNGTVAQFESTSTSAYVSLLESGGNHTYLGNSVGDFVVQTSAGGYSSKLVVYNGGNVAVPQGNLVMSSGGIDFGSTNSTSGVTVTGSTLDHYEEGTATVAFAAGGGTVTIKSTHNTIYYTRIGNVVHFNGELVVDSISSPTGELMITGLPFAAHNVSNNRSAISLHTSILNASTRLAGFVENGQSYVVVRLTGSTGYGQTAATVVQANSGIVVGGSYRTA